MNGAALGACLALWAVAPAAAAKPKKPKKRYAIELTGYGGIDRMITTRFDHVRELYSTNGGGALAGGILFRSPYFISPFFDAGYYPLYSSDQQFTRRVRAASSLFAYGFAFGPAVDFWRIRVKAGFVLYRVHAHSTLLGETITPAETDFGYTFAVSGYFLQTPRVQVGTELRAGFIVEADDYYVSYGLTVTGQPLTW